MKKRIEFACIAVMIVALCFVGCDIADGGETQESENDTVETSKYEYVYHEGIFKDRNWDSTKAQTAGTETDIDSAILIACREIEDIQKTGILKGYTLRGVNFDTEDEVWVVWFSNLPLQNDNGDVFIGTCYNVAVAKRSGTVLNMWPGE